jgi:hypothetical protein
VIRVGIVVVETMILGHSQLLRAVLLSACVVAGAGNLAQAQVLAPAPSQVGPPLLPLVPRPETQIPSLEPSAKPVVPNCRDANGTGCKRSRHNARHRRLRGAQ